MRRTHQSSHLIAALLGLLALAPPGCTSMTIPYIGPDAPRGTAAVSGTASVTLDQTWHETARDRLVVLVPKNDASDRWVNGLRNEARLGWSDAGADWGMNPSVVKRFGRTMLGGAEGAFRFTGLGAGSYYVIFRPSMGYTADALVDVAEGQQLNGVKVTRSFKR